MRAVLEQCKTTEEAVSLIQEIPIASNPNFIITDRTGNAVLIEVYGSKKAIKKIEKDSCCQFLLSTNHYTLPEMRRFNTTGIMENSVKRYALIEELLSSSEQIKNEEIKMTLSREYPEGLCCHYYDQFFGTLRSMIFNPQKGQVEICFGSSSVNSWVLVDFSTPGKQYKVVLPIKTPEDDFWYMARE